MQQTRGNWEATANSPLCSEPFTAGRFEADYAFASSFDISKRRLKPGTIPTWFERSDTATRKRQAVSSIEEVKKKKRGAFEKRERERLRVRNYFIY